MAELKHLDELLAVLVKHGVHVYDSDDGPRIELFPREPATPPRSTLGPPALGTPPPDPVSEFLAENPSDVCPCGHDSATHAPGSGLCREDCSPALCASKPGALPPRPGVTPPAG